MQHYTSDRLDQLSDRGRIWSILVDGNDDQAAELVLAPVGQNGRR